MSDEDDGQSLSLYWDLVSRAAFSNSSATTGAHPSVAQSSWNMLVSVLRAVRTQLKSLSVLTDRLAGCMLVVVRATGEGSVRGRELGQVPGTRRQVGLGSL